MLHSRRFSSLVWVLGSSSYFI